MAGMAGKKVSIDKGAIDDTHANKTVNCKDFSGRTLGLMSDPHFQK
jgi:hypothetical protein